MVNFCKTYYVKDLRNKEFVPTDNETYNDDDWYTSIIDVLPRFIVKMFANRELIIEDFLIFENIEKWKNGEFLNDVLIEEIKDSIDVLFLTKQRAYEMMFNALNEEYNPLWNVDGTEELEYTKDNTGKQTNENTKSGNLTDNVTYNGSETNTNVKTGNLTDNVNYVGKENDTKSGNTTNQTSPYDSDNFFNTSRENYNNVKNELEYLNRADNRTETYNNITDTNTKSFTTRSDNRTETYNNVKDSAERNDYLNEKYKEKKIRTGNIGVTKSQELALSEIELRNKYSFIEIVGRDIANLISIAIY